MDDSLKALIEGTISSQLGRSARYYEFDRSADSPLAFFLNEASRQLSTNFVVYWVDGGLAENFCLPSRLLTPIAYSARFLELTALVRNLFNDNVFASFRDELSERLCLRISSEFALRNGNVDWAVYAFLESILDQGIFFADEALITNLELEEINESYMAMWCYGLAHELGHTYLASETMSRSFLSDELILDTLKSALNDFPYPESLKQEFLQKAETSGNGFALGIEHLREECMADHFAIFMLFTSTTAIMRETAVRRGAEDADSGFDVLRFAYEMVMFMHLIGFTQRCKQIAATVAGPANSRYDLALSPVALAVRYTLNINQIVRLVNYHVYGRWDVEDAEGAEVFTEAVLKIAKSFNDAVAEVEKGTARAMRFALFPEEQNTNLLSELASRLFLEEPAARPTALIYECRKFLDLANSLDANSETLNVLKRIVRKAA